MTHPIRRPLNLPLSPLCVCVALTAVNPAPAFSQDVRATAQPVATLASGFTHISAARELSSGEVLVSDNQDRRVFVVNPARPSKIQIGRTGDGPGEYQIPLALRPIGTDSTILVDGGARRWLLLEGKKFVPLPERLRAASQISRGVLSGFDNVGNVLRTYGVNVDGQGGIYKIAEQPCCSAQQVVVRHAATGTLADTLARSKGGWAGERRNVIQKGEVYTLGSGFPTWDQAVMFPDGRVAFARLSPYQVEWILPDRRRIVGAHFNEPSIRVTASIKQEVARAHPMPGATPDKFASWPEYVPAFLREAVVAGFDGRLYISRTRISRKDSLVVDAIDQTNRRVSFTLPPRARFVSAGRNGLYIAIPDEDDVESLVLYRVSDRR